MGNNFAVSCVVCEGWTLCLWTVYDVRTQAIDTSDLIRTRPFAGITGYWLSTTALYFLTVMQGAMILRVKKNSSKLSTKPCDQRNY